MSRKYVGSESGSERKMIWHTSDFLKRTARLPIRMAFMAIVLWGLQGGCRNRCGPGGWNPWGPATIPPPPTYSLQLPGGNVSQSTLANPTAATQSSASTATGNMQNATASNQSALGWNTPAGSPGAAAPAIYGTSNYQVASSSVFGTGNGTSRVVNHDYSSTPYNDRLDPTRLGISDASQVRAPVNYSQNYSPFVDPRLAPGTSPVVFGSGATMPGRNPTLGGQALVQGQFSSGFAGQPATGFPTPAPNPANDPNRQAGWQNRNGINR